MEKVEGVLAHLWVLTGGAGVVGASVSAVSCGGAVRVGYGEVVAGTLGVRLLASEHHGNERKVMVDVNRTMWVCTKLSTVRSILPAVADGGGVVLGMERGICGACELH